MGTGSDKVSPTVIRRTHSRVPSRISTLLQCQILLEHPVLTLVGVVLVGGFDELGFLPLGLQRNRFLVKILEREKEAKTYRHI